MSTLTYNYKNHRLASQPKRLKTSKILLMVILSLPILAVISSFGAELSKWQEATDHVCFTATEYRKTDKVLDASCKITGD